MYVGFTKPPGARSICGCIAIYKFFLGFRLRGVEIAPPDGESNGKIENLETRVYMGVGRTVLRVPTNSYELSFKLLVSPLITPMVVPI